MPLGTFSVHMSKTIKSFYPRCLGGWAVAQQPNTAMVMKLRQFSAEHHWDEWIPSSEPLTAARLRDSTFERDAGMCLDAGADW